MNTSASLPSRASNVTTDNFTKKAVAFVKANDDAGFVIALNRYPGLAADAKFIPTPRQWGAWMAYWARLPYKHKAIVARGYGTAPSEWPHEFDAAATIQGDHAAADAFEARWRDEQESRTFHAGSIAQQTSRAVSMWNAIKREQGKPTPESHLHPDMAQAVDVSDFPPSNSSPQELRDWEARQKASAA